MSDVTRPPVEPVAPVVVARPVVPHAAVHEMQLTSVRRRDAALDLSLVLVVAILTQFVPSVVAGILKLDHPEFEANEYVLIVKSTEVLLVAAMLAYFIARCGIHRRALGIRFDRPVAQLGWAAAAVAGAYAVMIASVVIVVVAVAFVPGLSQDMWRRVEFAREVHQFTFAQSTILLVAVALHEEILFRALLIPYLWRVTGRGWAALLISSAIFAFLHYPQGWIAVGQILGLALVFGGVFIASRSLSALVLAHFLFNFTQLRMMRWLDLEHLREILEPQGQSAAQAVIEAGKLLLG